MSDPPVTGPNTCPECGRENAAASTQCWLCEARLEANPYALPADHVSTADGRFSFSLATLLVVLTSASVLCGLFAIEPGLGIVAAVLLTPAMIRTALVMRKREAAGLSVGPAQKVLLLAGSFVTTAVILTVVGIASFGTFCGVCLGIYSLDESAGTGGLGFIVAAGAALVATGTVLGFVARWVRRRWHRDTRKP